MSCAGVEPGSGGGIPPGWELINPRPGENPEALEELARPLGKGEQADRRFRAVDDDAEVVVCWGRWVQQWRVFSVHEGQQGPDAHFAAHECGAALKEALDRLWAYENSDGAWTDTIDG